MTDTNQKLREALQAISDIDDSTNHAADASAALGRIGRIARQALALPTADHIPDAGEMVADHLPDAGKMIEAAAPVGERERFEQFAQNCPMGKYNVARRGEGYDSSHTQIMWDAWQARAALSADDAADAQRYRWLREQHWSNSAICCVYKPKQNVRLGGTCPSGDLLDSAIDKAMRKGQL